MEPPLYKVLLVDDDIDFIGSVKTVLKEVNLVYALNIPDASRLLSPELDLILLDLVFDETNPDNLSGLDFLSNVKSQYPDLPVVIITNHTDTEITVKAMKTGAEDFINKKSLNWSEWSSRIYSYCKKSSRIRYLSERARELESAYDETEMIGTSPAINYIKTRLKDLARNSSEVSIFLCGETGTGKNLAARYFYKHSQRKEKPFREFSLFQFTDTIIESELFGYARGAFTGADKSKNGLFEEANGGILFLDEIGDYDLRTQKKIMKFIDDRVIIPVGGTESRRLDVQLIMATNQNLELLISRGEFRHDLYQRINHIKIEIPPLRQRREDIPMLIDYYFSHFRQKEKTNLVAIEDNALEVFMNYNWPGNVRELQLAIWDACTRARLFNDKILTSKHIREEILEKADDASSEPEGGSIKVKKAMLELSEIEEALAKAGGRKLAAAESLGISLDKMRYLAARNAEYITEKKYPAVRKAYDKIIIKKKGLIEK